jgi:hypothetical protein
MDFIHDIDLVTGLAGSVVSSLAEFPDLINTPIAGSINFYDVKRPALSYCLTYEAGVARFLITTAGETIYSFGQNAAGAGLTGASRAAKEVGVSDATGAQGIK